MVEGHPKRVDSKILHNKFAGVHINRTFAAELI